MVFDKHFLGYDRRKLGLQNDCFTELVIIKLLGCFFESSFANSLEINFLHKYSLLSVPSIPQERTGSKTESEVNTMKSRLIQETVSYEGACEMLDCGKNTVHNLCKAGELASVIHAGRRRIYIDSIEEYANRVREKAFAASLNHK